MEFLEFATRIATDFELETAISSSTEFASVGFDSIALFELVLILEEYGAVPSDDEVQAWKTFGEAFDSLRVDRRSNIRTDGPSLKDLMRRLDDS
jgi:acyl carrier protein